MPWNPFASKPKDIELPNETGRRDPRLPKPAKSPGATLKDSLATWKKLNTDTALSGLKNYNK